MTRDEQIAEKRDHVAKCRRLAAKSEGSLKNILTAIAEEGEAALAVLLADDD